MLSLLLAWYTDEGRDLPWRKTNNPYHILVSEMMLQQTQVLRVLAYYPRFLDMFPNWEILANATNSQMIEAWAGLGYNRRALMLRDIARHVVQYGEPTKREGWLVLRGIGPYTSAAIAIFADQEIVMPIDTNTRRVLARLYLSKPYPGMKDDALLETIGTNELANIEHAREIPQALFDLGSSYCGKIPDCANCPMRSVCASAELFLSGDVKVPKRMVKKANERIQDGKNSPDRIYRGRILKLIRENAGLTRNTIGPRIDNTYAAKDQEWIDAMIDRLIKDGMLEERKKGLYLSSA
ncbi:MAG: A/G-specific adenine glycosylase [bacterium]|nr:A/G-specific adenine glycosylase [bacterium]